MGRGWAQTERSVRAVIAARFALEISGKTNEQGHLTLLAWLAVLPVSIIAGGSDFANQKSAAADRVCYASARQVTLS
jgi:hypothetical protein